MLFSAITAFEIIKNRKNYEQKMSRLEQFAKSVFAKLPTTKIPINSRLCQNNQINLNNQTTQKNTLAKRADRGSDLLS